jgi:hypothetical protein
MITIADIFREVLPEGHSFSEARRQVHMEDVRFNGEQVTSMQQEVEVKDFSLFQVGKRSMWQRDGSKWIRLGWLETDTEYGFSLPDTLNDPGRADLELHLRLRGANEPLLVIGAEGYGEMTAQDGHGFPIVIEYHERQFRILVWGDINQEDPTHVISLEGAREDARRTPERD